MGVLAAFWRLVGFAGAQGRVSFRGIVGSKKLECKKHFSGTFAPAKFLVGEKVPESVRGTRKARQWGRWHPLEGLSVLPGKED